MQRQKYFHCKFIDSDGRMKFEKVLFVESSFSTQDDSMYRLNGYIAAGGNGAIFRCYLAETNEEFAVKFLHVPDPVRRERFDFEYLVLSDLDHPNILPAYDVGLVETTFKNPIPFIITKFFPETVEGRLRNHGVFSIEEVKKYGKQMCQAFNYLHSQGIIHRDVKPSNLLLDGDLLAVGDLGLAKTLTEEGRNRFWRGDVTTTEECIGSVTWMSPELFRYAEQKTTKVDHRSDLFQIGKIMWYMHTMEAIGIPDKDSDQSGGKLFDIVMKAIQANPDKRFQHALEMQEALDDVARS